MKIISLISLGLYIVQISKPCPSEVKQSLLVNLEQPSLSKIPRLPYIVESWKLL